MNMVNFCSLLFLCIHVYVCGRDSYGSAGSHVDRVLLKETSRPICRIQKHASHDPRRTYLIVPVEAACGCVKAQTYCVFYMKLDAGE